MAWCQCHEFVLIGLEETTRALESPGKGTETETMRLPQARSPRSATTARLARPLAALLLLCGANFAAAQLSEATDTAALRDFGAGSTDDKTATWTNGTSPCGDGWDNFNAGWVGVSCCANGQAFCDGSQAWYPVSTRQYPVGTMNARRVQAVDLSYLPGVRGDLADLAGVTELQKLYLRGTNAHGDIAHLLGLTLLTYLWLGNPLGGADCHVYGNASAIRATIPGLSDGFDGVWDGGWGGSSDYTACSTFASCPAGASPIAGGDDVVGADACACCDGSPMVREPATGVCVDPGALSLRAR